MNIHRDENRVTVIAGVSSIDVSTPTEVAVNPNTHALLIDGPSLYTTLDTRYLELDGTNQASWTPTTVLVTNLNADLLDGNHLSDITTTYDSRYLKLDASNDPITGDLTVNSSLVVNETGTSTANFRVEGDTNANLLNTSALYDTIGIGAAATEAAQVYQQKVSAQATAGYWQYGYFIDYTAQPSTAPTGDWRTYGAYFSVQGAGVNNIPSLYGARFNVLPNVTGTITTAVGGQFIATSTSTSGTQITTNVDAGQFYIIKSGAGTWNYQTMKIIDIPTPSITTGTIVGLTNSNAYGIFIGSLTGLTATNIYSILTTNGHAVFNENAEAYNFRVESDLNPNMLLVDGTNNRVGIGIAPQSELDVAAVTGPVLRLTSTSNALNTNDISGKIAFYKTDGSTGGAGIIPYIQARTTNSGGDFVLEAYTGTITTPVRNIILGATGAVFNEDGVAALNFRVESDTNVNMLYVDSTNNRVGIGTVPTNTFHVLGTSSLVSTSTAQGTAFNGVAITATKTSAADDATTNNGINLAFGTAGTFAYSGVNSALSASYYHSGSGLVSDASGFYFIGGVLSTGNMTSFDIVRARPFGAGAGTIGTLTCFRAYDMAATGTPTTMYGFKVDTSTGAVGTNKYGFWCGNIQGATNNYAIQTNAGNVVFNEGGDANSDFRVESDTEANMLFVDANANTDGSLYLGGTTNGIEIKKGGELELLGTATVWDDLRIEPVVRSTGVKAPTFTSWAGGLYLYDFDDAVVASEKEVFFTVQMPHGWKEGSAVEPHVHWLNKTAGTAGQVIRWGLEYSKAKIGATFSTTTTTVYGTTIAGGGDITVANEHMLTDFASIDMTGDTISTVLICRLFRNSSDAADTYAGTAGLLYIDWHVEINSMGSKTELAK